MRAFVRLALTLTALCGMGLGMSLVACDDGPSQPVHTHEDDCMTYTQGVSITTDTGGYTVAIIDSQMTPPDRGMNTFVLKVTDADGNPVDSGIGLKLIPFMPQHGHGSDPAEVVATPRGADGEYDADQINLFMPGAWDVNVELVPDGSSDEHKGVFTFCIEG